VSILAIIAEIETVEEGKFSQSTDKLHKQYTCSVSFCEINAIVNCFQSSALVCCKSAPFVSSLAIIAQIEAIEGGILPHQQISLDKG
jgi:hypothetical protein